MVPSHIIDVAADRQSWRNFISGDLSSARRQDVSPTSVFLDLTSTLPQPHLAPYRCLQAASLSYLLRSIVRNAHYMSSFQSSHSVVKKQAASSHCGPGAPLTFLVVLACCRRQACRGLHMTCSLFRMRSLALWRCASGLMLFLPLRSCIEFASVAEKFISIHRPSAKGACPGLEVSTPGICLLR